MAGLTVNNPKHSSGASPCSVWTLGIVFLFVLLTGCQQPVGGHCEYKEQLGILEVIKTVEGNVVGVFTPAIGHDNSQLEGFELPTMADLTLYQFYPATLSVRTTGSCTPFFINLTSDNNWSRSILVPLDEEGRETVETILRLKDVVAMLKTLQSSWPTADLLLYGYGSQGYSSEYRLQLAHKYEQQIKHRFEELGLLSQHMIVTGGILPEHLVTLNPEGNGVQVFFDLQ